MRKLLPLLVLSVLAAPPAARADGSIAINLRAGVEKPWGDFAKARPMSDVASWAFPFQGDLQFRLTKSLQVGAYGRYALISVADRAKTLCDAATPKSSCPASDVGFGGVVEYRFSDRMEGGGWVGASVGYEIFKSESSDASSGTRLKTTRTLTGLEAGVQSGIDFELGGLTVGPFLQLSAGQFTSSKIETAAGATTAATSSSGSIADKRLHGYAGLGVRISILL